MKFNQFSKKEQEIRNSLFAEAFGSFSGIGLHTSVVTTTPDKMPNVKGIKELERTLDFTSMNTRKVPLTDSYTAHIASIS